VALEAVGSGEEVSGVSGGHGGGGGGGSRGWCPLWFPFPPKMSTIILITLSDKVIWWRLFNKFNNLFYFFTSYLAYNAPKMMVSRFPCMSCSWHLPSIVPSIAAACFWLVVVYIHRMVGV
jgi:hypothetical protein